MTREQYLIKRKMNILDLGSQLGNISDACRKLGISRQHFYDIRKAVEEEGVQALLEKSRKIARPLNRVTSEIEEALLQYSLEYPTHGQVRVANELHRKGMIISAGGVRSVWLRHDLELKAKRLKRLEKWAAENTPILTESQVVALEAAKQVQEAHGEIETFKGERLKGNRLEAGPSPEPSRPKTMGVQARPFPRVLPRTPPRGNGPSWTPKTILEGPRFSELLPIPFPLGTPPSRKSPRRLASQPKHWGPAGQGILEAASRLGDFGLALPQRRLPARAPAKSGPGREPIKGWELRVLSKPFSHR